jgi:uroporphyrinogen decarboxylase
MTSRERVRAIFGHRTADRTGFWLGNPHPDSWPLYFQAFGLSTQTEVRQMLGNDLRWLYVDGISYRHPQGKPILVSIVDRKTGRAPLAECESVPQVDDFAWPNPDYLDFTKALAELLATGDLYRASGFWSPFFHQLADLFGMENYFIKMFTHPDVVHAATRRLVDFYLEANRRLYDQVGPELDGFFFGNDFGTQLDLLVGPAQMGEFIFPYFRQLTDQAHARGYQVILHSCGAIHRVIPDLLAMGVDALHPLQALAARMDAETLARDFAGRVAFMGGIDTQQLLVHGSPAAVRADVRRVRRILGPHLVISPSHEALLPNVPPANVRAMAEAALE